MQNLKSELRKELVDNILPYWMEKVTDNENGGFYGQIDGCEQLHRQANKGAVMNARILWTFSAAYRLLKDPQYLAAAERAFRYMLDYFIDKEYGGIYWELDYLGNPVKDSKQIYRKQIYAQGFALYGFSEFYRATGRKEALDEAIKMFRFIEEKAYDPEYEGYFEARGRAWEPIDDMTLSERDINVPKSMNTHLHILEPYTNLLRIWHSEELVEAQKRLIHNFCDHLISSETNHLILFFDREWNPFPDPKSKAFSYGHDIETSWLLYEAAEVLGDKELLAKVIPTCMNVINAAYEGLQDDGSLIYESIGDHFDRDRHWWVQAETVVGSAYASKISGDAAYLQKAQRAWEYIKKYIIDKENGEWFWGASPDGKPNRENDKAGFWKCPYHNARMCMEIMEL